MTKEGFFYRIRTGGWYRILTGYDLYLSILSVVLIGVYTNGDLSTFDLGSLVSNTVTFSTSLTAVIVSGITIIVALTDPDFLRIMKRNQVYQNFLFTFEYTAFLSISVSVLGIYMQSYDFGIKIFFVYLFLFLYLVLAVFRLISQIVSLGDRRGDVAVINELSNAVSNTNENDTHETDQE